MSLENLPLYKHQQDALDRFADAPYFALHFEEQTGKTRVAILHAARLWREKKIAGVIVVAMPSGAPGNWASGELPDWLPSDIPRKAFVWRASKATSVGFKRSFENLLYRDGKFAWLLINGEAIITEACKKGINAFIKAYKDILVIADETSLLMKTPSGKRTRNMWTLARYAKHRMILDATPADESPMDVYAPYRFLHPSILGHETFTSYRNHFALVVQRNFGRGPVQVIATDSDGKKIYRNLDELNERMAAYSSRVLRADVFDLPPKVYKSDYFDLSDQQQSLYDTLRSGYQIELDSGEKIDPQNVLVMLLRLQQIASNFLPSGTQAALCDQCKGQGCDNCNDEGVIYTETPGLLKITDHDPRLERLESHLAHNDRAVVFCKFTHDIEAVMGLCRDMRRSFVRYDGAVNPAEKEKAKLAYQNGDVGVFIANARAAGRALRLPSQRIVFYSHEFSLLVRGQAENRAEAANNKRETSTLIVTLLAAGTVDETTVEAYRDKRKIASIIMDRKKI